MNSGYLYRFEAGFHYPCVTAHSQQSQGGWVPGHCLHAPRLLGQSDLGLAEVPGQSGLGDPPDLDSLVLGAGGEEAVVKRGEHEVGHQLGVRVNTGDRGLQSSVNILQKHYVNKIGLFSSPCLQSIHNALSGLPAVPRGSTARLLPSMSQLKARKAPLAPMKLPQLW